MRWLLVILAACGNTAAPKPPPANEASGGTAAPAPEPEPAKLAITGIEPDTVDEYGGTYVVIKGTRFIADGPRNVKVYFGSRQGTVIRFASDRELIVQTPPGKEGEVVDVLVIFDPGGQKKLPGALKFVHKQ